MRALVFVISGCAGLVAALTTPSVRTRPSGEAQVGVVAIAAAASSAPDVYRRLKSGDEAQVKAALDDVRMAGRAGAASVPAIVDMLRAGMSPVLTQAALETLGDVESEAASEVLGWYARHRNVALRRAAVDALGKTKGATAAKVLRTALADPDEAVRGSAATSLGSMRVRDAVPDLFAALDHGVAEAAVSIGELCAPAECEKLLAKIGSLPFDVVTSGLDQVLLRPAPEITDELKLSIVGRVRELGTAEANQFLKGVQAKWPPKGSKRIRQALDQAVLATSASPGGREPEAKP